VSAGGRLTINASPPGWTLRSVAEREQFGCDQGKLFVQHIQCDETVEFINLTPRSTDGSGRLNVQIKSTHSVLTNAYN